MIKWTPHNTDSRGNKYSEAYYATWGTYKLSKNYVAGIPRYRLCEGKTSLGVFNSKEEASEWLLRRARHVGNG